MKHRNPLFVAGFPYAMIFVAYAVLVGISMTTPQEANTLSPTKLVALIGGFGFMLAGSFYSLYWLISTAREMRYRYKSDIPASILVVIPIANLWWEWKYAEASETATQGKIQGVIAFVLLVLLGSIGMGILQDSYNKVALAEAHAVPPTSPAVPTPTQESPTQTPVENEHTDEHKDEADKPQ